MKKLIILGLAAGLASLGACNSSPREQAADNIEENAEAVADNIEATDDGTGMAQNQADAVREAGQNQADDMRTHDADTNLANGI